MQTPLMRVVWVTFSRNNGLRKKCMQYFTKSSWLRNKCYHTCFAPHASFHCPPNVASPPDTLPFLLVPKHLTSYHVSALCIPPPSSSFLFVPQHVSANRVCKLVRTGPILLQPKISMGQIKVHHTMTYRSIRAVHTDPIKDQYGQYILVCWYASPYRISVHQYVSYRRLHQ